MEQLAAAGVDRLGIAVDAASKTLFNKVKGLEVGGGYRWDALFRRLDEALAVFGKNNVSTHLIVGLGETEKEAAEFLQRCVDLGSFASAVCVYGGPRHRFGRLSSRLN